jgi:enolase
MSTIAAIKANEILSSSGTPTIEAEITLDSGFSAAASVAFGASVGNYEALTLFDCDPKRYAGLGMLQAVDNINRLIAPQLIGAAIADQAVIDQKLISLDGTDRKLRLGGNALLAVSLAVARAAALDQNIPLYRYLRQTYGFTGPITFPKPMAVMIEGGRHAANSTDFQEYLITVLQDKPVSDNLRLVEEIYQQLERVLSQANLSTNVGREGAFAPAGINANQSPFDYLLTAIKAAAYSPGTDVALSLDAAASEFFQNGQYHLRLENKSFTASQLIDYYLSWLNQYPIVSFEDMLSQDDWSNWITLTEKLASVRNIADDLTATNLHRLEKAIELKAANGLIVKLNQAGTLTETIACCKLAQKSGFWLIPSHRGGGETNDDFLVDLAIAVNAPFIKVGPTRGERVAKYNRLLKIASELDK